MKHLKQQLLSAVFVAAALVAASATAPAAEKTRPPALKKPVTLAEKGRPLPTSLSAMSKQAEVSLHAVADLADRRLTVRLTKLPAKEVMKQLAELWTLPRRPAEWRKEKPEAKASPAYQLWQSPEAAEELQRRMDADRERITASLPDLIQLARNGGDEALRGGDRYGQTGNPVMDQALYRPNWQHGMRASMRFLGDLSRPALNGVLHGQTFWAPFKSLSASTQSAMMSDVAGNYRRGSRQPDGSIRYQTKEEARSAFQKDTLGIQLRLKENPATGDSKWMLYLRQRDSPYVQGMPLGDLGLADANSGDGAARSADDPLFKEPLPESLKKALGKVKTWDEFADFQVFLATHTELGVLSDYYYDISPPQPRLLVAAKSMGDLLEKACGPASYRWWSKDKTVFFRQRRWYLKDLKAPPATLELRFQASQKERGYLNLDDLSAAAAMNDAQLDRMARILAMPGLKGLRQYRVLFRWYAALTNREKHLVGRPQGLAIRSTGERAKAELRRPSALRKIMGGLSQDPGKLIISIRQYERESEVITVFDAGVPGGSRSRTRFVQKRRVRAAGSK